MRVRIEKEVFRSVISELTVCDVDHQVRVKITSAYNGITRSFAVVGFNTVHVGVIYTGRV